MPNERRFFRPRPRETGRHQSFEQTLDGEYAFRLDQGGRPMLDTYNAATGELQAIIKDCVDDGKTLRARGSLWSLSPVAVTDGRLIDTKALRLAFSFPAGLIDPAYGGDAAKLRFVECGNSISALNDHLFADRLSLPASGSNNGQTIAGALSTNTHGGAYRFGALAEMVAGLHLVVGPGRHVYLERRSKPVTKPDFARQLGAEFIQDDTLFNAALISFGSFGVIHGLMIEPRELFILNAVRYRAPYDDVLKTALAGADPTLLPLPPAAAGVPTGTPYHFEVFFNPNEGTPPAEAIVLVMYEEPWTESYDPPVWDGGESGMGASGLDVMGALFDMIPTPLDRLVVPILNAQVRDEFAPYVKKAIIRDLFRGEKVLGRTLACAMGMPADRAVEAQEIAFQVYEDEGDVLPAIISHRFVKGTDALLGFTRFDPTAVFEIDGINLPSVRGYLEKVWEKLDAAGIPFTMHWGKFNTHLNPARVRQRYGDAAVDQWIAARETLLESAEVRKVFANDFLARMGLAT